MTKGIYFVHQERERERIKKACATYICMSRREPRSIVAGMTERRLFSKCLLSAEGENSRMTKEERVETTDT